MDEKKWADAEKNDPQFAAVYRNTAERGESDAWISMESMRVYRQWLTASKPEDIEGFIRKHANKAP